MTIVKLLGGNQSQSHHVNFNFVRLENIELIYVNIIVKASIPG